MAVLSSRKIDNGSCLKYHNQYYLPVDEFGVAVHHHKGTSVMVIKAFDGEIYACIGELVYGLCVLSNHCLVSKAFDLAKLTEKPKEKYIPPMSHPWEKASFDNYMAKQSHRKDAL